MHLKVVLVGIFTAEMNVPSIRNMSTDTDVRRSVYGQLLADLEMLDRNTWSDDATIVDGDILTYLYLLVLVE